MNRLRWHFRCIAAVASSYVLGTRTALSVIGFVCQRILGVYRNDKRHGAEGNKE